MEETKKSCGTCKYSYYAQDCSQHPTIGLLRQYCSNEKYIAMSYTEAMCLEDRKRGYCRFWAPEEREKENNEEPLLH